MRIVHYINQFFGGVGGEEMAGTSLEAREGAVGPGRLLEQVFGDGSTVVTTLICGDNYAAEHIEEVAAEVVTRVREANADVFVAGPCFGAGRYGIAAGGVCVAVQAELGIPAVPAMAGENPGVDLHRSELYIVDSGQNLAEMREVLEKVARLATKLADNEPIGRPEDEEYHSRGLLRSEFVERSTAQRLLDMLVAKTTGQAYQSELPVSPFPPVPRPPAVADLSKAKIGLVTDGGLVPAGNPDKFPTAFAQVWGAYDISAMDDLEQGSWEVAHSGYDNRPVLQDPDRLVPVDALRELEKDGVVGELNNEILSTTGNVNPLANSRRMGREMAERLMEAGVDAVILTST